MTIDDLRRRAAAHGIDPGYRDVGGGWHEAPAATLVAALEAVGADPASDAPPPADGAWPPIVVVCADRAASFEPAPGAVLVSEAGERVALEGALPPALPPGYHELVGDGRRTRLVVAPPRCYLPPGLAAGGRAWGFALQLYALRSSSSWGIGDLGDLAAVATAPVAEPGFVLLNPLHAPTLAGAIEPSPYFASSRVFRNPLYLCIEQLPDVEYLDQAGRQALEALAARGREANAEALIDREAAFAAKDAALRLLHAALPPTRRAALAAYRAATPDLDAFAIFSAIAREHGADPSCWPSALRDPASAQTAALAAEHVDETAYAAYLQLLLDEQLAALPPLPVGLIADLAVGAAGTGFDAWLDGNALAHGFTVGAPPDPLGPLGQDWGLPPLVPGRLRALGHEPFARAVRANMRHAGGLRIDHVMGLFRLFWVPADGEPADGTYVRYPADELLGVLALESVRASALVIGEDLGTVEHGVRETLAERGVLSCRLSWFERGPDGPHAPGLWPRQALASVSSHDLPTVAGYMTGADLAAEQALGRIPPDRVEEVWARWRWERGELLGQLRGEGLLGVDDEDPERIAAALYALLARTPAMLVAVSLDDVLGALRRPNMPGTVHQHPNWSIPLPVAVDDLRHDPRLQRVVSALAAVR